MKSVCKPHFDFEPNKFFTYLYFRKGLNIDVIVKNDTTPFATHDNNGQIWKDDSIEAVFGNLVFFFICGKQFYCCCCVRSRISKERFYLSWRLQIYD